jgi:hypothetical protein
VSNKRDHKLKTSEKRCLSSKILPHILLEARDRDFPTSSTIIHALCKLLPHPSFKPTTHNTSCVIAFFFSSSPLTLLQALAFMPTSSFTLLELATILSHNFLRHLAFVSVSSQSRQSLLCYLAHFFPKWEYHVIGPLLFYL